MKTIPDLQQAVYDPRRSYEAFLPNFPARDGFRIFCVPCDRRIRARSIAGRDSLRSPIQFGSDTPRTIAQATARATRIFAGTGIRTSWEQPAADSPEAHWLDLNTSDVKLSHSRGRACLVVRLVQDVPSNAYNGALGFALPLARSGVNVEIIYRRIEFQAEYPGLPADLLLAYTMAHEIGHVLLRSSAHAPAGIMQAKWNADNWRLASFDMVSFLPEQAKRMREELYRFEIQEQRLPTELNPVLAGP